MSRSISRRGFLKLAGTGAAGAAMVGASGYPVLMQDVQYMPENPAPEGNAMNVILIIIDSTRKDHIGAYGADGIKTPSIDALAKQSLRFTRAHPESGWTIPARRAIHTGIRSYPLDNWWTPAGAKETGPGWNPIPQDQGVFPDILRSQGYSTMLVSDNYHQCKPSYNFQRGFDSFYYIRGQEVDQYAPLWKCPPQKLDESLMKKRALVEDRLRQYFANVSDRRGEEDYFPARIFTHAAGLLEGMSREYRPFFMMIDSIDPHEPWDPPKKYVDLYDDSYSGPEPYLPIYGSSDYLSDRELQRMHALYAGELTMVDHWIGNFLQKVDELGLMEDTMVMFLSDHGHAFGEHGLVGKPPEAQYPELIDVPYMISHPSGKMAGRESDYFASTHDLAPTILGALGLGIPQEMEGQDLSVLFDGGQPPGRDYMTGATNDYVWAKDDDHYLICGRDKSNAKLFDNRADPRQKNDIAPDNPEIVDRMYNDYVLADAGGSMPPLQKVEGPI